MNLKNGVEVKSVPIDSVKLSPYNPRIALKPGDPEYEQIKASLVRFGLVEPLVLNGHNNVLVGGHQRIRVMKDLGYKKILVSIVDIKDLKAEKALNIALNKISGEWDLPRLKEILVELDDGSFDLSLIGFDESELKDLIDYEGKKGMTDDDEVPPVPTKPVTKPGDLYILGEHRLFCGDSNLRKSFDYAIGSKSIDMVLMDPPYGTLKIFNKKGEVGVSNVAKCKQYGAYQNEGTYKIEPLLEIVNGKTKKMVIWGGNYFQLPITTSWLCWDKTAGEHSWFSDFELAWTNLGTPARIFKYVWQGMIREGEKEERQHPTQKPIPLAEWIVQEWTEKDDLVVDFFGGSGWTLMACEKTGRRNISIEISPAYCDVIVKRWEAFTGEERRSVARIKFLKYHFTSSE